MLLSACSLVLELAVLMLTQTMELRTSREPLCLSLQKPRLCWNSRNPASRASKPFGAVIGEIWRDG